MSKKKVDKLEELYNLLNEKFNQTTIFEVEDERIVELCKDILGDKGYKVISKPANRLKAKNIDDLINNFYNLLDFVIPSQMERKNLARDRAIAKGFLESKMECGLTEEAALRECSLIIHTVLRNLDKFSFKKEYLDFKIFGKKHVGWISTKVAEILREKQYKLEDEMSDAYCKEVMDHHIEKYGVESIGLINEIEEEKLNGKEKGR